VLLLLFIVQFTGVEIFQKLIGQNPNGITVANYQPSRCPFLTVRSIKGYKCSRRHEVIYFFSFRCSVVPHQGHFSPFQEVLWRLLAILYTVSQIKRGHFSFRHTFYSF